MSSAGEVRVARCVRAVCKCFSVPFLSSGLSHRRERACGVGPVPGPGSLESRRVATFSVGPRIPTPRPKAGRGEDPHVYAHGSACCVVVRIRRPERSALPAAVAGTAPRGRVLLGRHRPGGCVAAVRAAVGRPSARARVVRHRVRANAAGRSSPSAARDRGAVVGRCGRLLPAGSGRGRLLRLPDASPRSSARVFVVAERCALGDDARCTPAVLGRAWFRTATAIIGPC